MLLTGDSITQGRHQDFTWRYRLDRELQRQGAQVDLVGSRSAPYVQAGYSSSSYADAAFDRNHFAIFGWQLRSMVGAIRAEVAAQQPDVVVLEAGVNDLRNHPDDPNVVADMEASLRQWIANVRAGKAETRILLSPVLSLDTPRAPGLNPKILSYNARMRAVASELSTIDSPITVASTNTGWKPVTMTYDGLHPTPTGETFIAQRIAEALKGVGLLGATPRIYAVTPYSRMQRPRITVAGKKATLTWARQAVSSVRVEHRRARGKWLLSPWNSSGRAVVKAKKAGSYQFRIVQRRGRMVGPWGPLVQRRLPVKAKRLAAPAHVTVDAAGVHWTSVPAARSYVVKLKRNGTKGWKTRRTTGLKVVLTKVRVAKVRSVSGQTRSVWRRAAR